jgi:hypothetical protein
MVRTFAVKRDTSLQSLSGALLDARYRGPQAEAAVEQLKALNPHANLEELKAGTVLFVPDAPGFKSSAATSAQAVPLEEFRALLSNALGDAARNVRSANAARASERADVAAILKSAAFKRLAGSDRELAQQAEDAQKAMKNEETQDKQAEESIAVVGKAALAALAQIGKIVG